MNDFDFDVMQKKRIAQGARHRVSRSKSKKCTLPYERLTPSQVKKLSGPAESFQLGKPMDWEKFKSASGATQKEYLSDMHQRYHVGPSRLAQMFGVSKPTMSKFLATSGLGVAFPRQTHMTQDEIRAWEEFLAGTQVSQTDIAEDEPYVPVDHGPDAGVLDSLEELGATISVDGYASEVLPRVLRMLERHDPYVRISLSFCRKEDEPIETEDRNGAEPLS